MKTNAESALVVLVPEAERVVDSFRRRHDPSAAAGVPAHITVLYPFKAPAQIDAADLDLLNSVFSMIAPFSFTLPTVGNFGHQVLFLTVDPDTAFKDLTSAVYASFPECEPYRGQHAELIPHLTLADRLPDENAFNRVARDFRRASEAQLPIISRAEHVALLDNLAGKWAVRTVFPLQA